MKNTKFLFGLSIILCLNAANIFAQEVYDLGWYTHPAGNHYYEIGSSSELEGLAYVCNTLGDLFENDTIALTANIDWGNTQTISKFAGYLEGNNHTISNIDKSMFDTIMSQSTIAGLKTEGYIKTYDFECGIYAIVCEGSLINCANYANLKVSNSSTYSFVGAFCARLNRGNIVNCQNYGSVVDEINATKFSYVQRCGGVVGQANQAQIIHTCNYGQVTASSFCFVSCGGIVGDLQSGLIWDCKNYGKINSTIYPSSTPSSNMAQSTGGIVGLAQGWKPSRIDACINVGDVTSNCYMVAGIVGIAQDVNVFNCVNYGYIHSTEYYYFGCANGICSWFQGDKMYFVNCVNQGNIYAETNGYIATAGGTCALLEGSIIANLLSTGTVDAYAMNGGSSFKVPNYGIESDVTIDNTVSSIAEMNLYVQTQPYTDKGFSLLPWKAEGDSISLGHVLSGYVVPSCGEASLYYYFSEDIEQSYTLHLQSAEEQMDTTIYEDKIYMAGLKPNTEYTYRLQADYFYETLPLTGTFQTDPIDFQTEIEVLPDSKRKVKTVVNAGGLKYTEIGYLYKENTSNTWTQLVLKDSFATVFEAQLYTQSLLVKPYVITRWGKIEGNPTALTIDKITPQLTISDVTLTSVRIRCENDSLFKEYEWGLILYNTEEENDSVVKPNTNDGIFNFQNLKAGGIYSIWYYLNTPNGIVKDHLDDCQLSTFEMHEPLYISSTAFALKVDYVGSKTEMSLLYIEYRDLYESPQSYSNYAYAQECENEYYFTIAFTESGLTQYRLILNGAVYTDWMIVDNQSTNCTYVPVLFTNIAFYKQEYTNFISCKKLLGELPEIEVGFEYKFDFQESYYSIALGYNVDLSVELNNLVAGYTYEGRFYSKSVDTTFYSETFKFTKDGIITPIPLTNHTTQTNETEVKKVIMNGQIYIILSDGSKYNLMGQRR